jgi:hypothetical protein
MRGIILIVTLLLFLSTTDIHTDDAALTLPEWVIKDYDAKLAVTWYKTPPKDSEFSNTFALSIGQKSGSPPWLVLRIAYTYPWERDIILIYKYTVNIDGIPYTIRTGFNSVNRSLNYVQKNYSEWYDNYVYSDLVTIINGVANSKVASIGFYGINGSAERLIEKAEKDKFKAMLEIFKTLSEK